MQKRLERRRLPADHVQREVGLDREMFHRSQRSPGRSRLLHPVSQARC